MPIEKELNVIRAALMKNKYLTSDQISKLFKPAMHIRTVQRRIDEFKKLDCPYYLVGDKVNGFRLIDKNVDWSLLKFQREKKNLRKNTVLHTDLYNKKMSNNINNLNLAMEGGNYVELLEYKSVSANENNNYTVFPLKMVINDKPYILALDKEAKKVKKFIIERIGSVELTKEKSNYDREKLLKNERIDDFGFSIEKEKWEIELLLTNYSMNMFINDHYHLNDKITKIKPPINPVQINGEDYYFSYLCKINVSSMRVIGRLMTGMLDHIKVHEADDKFKSALREYIQKSVINVIDKNIN